LKKVLAALPVLLLAGTASAGVPLFAARCSTDINVDSNAKGQVYVNGNVAGLINRPDGQVTAQSAGVFIDITPQGDQPPRVTYTARDKSVGTCTILSFAPPGGGAAAASTGGGGRASSAERAGQGQFDATSVAPCAQSRGQPLNQQCQLGVARDGNGTAMVVITRPDGRKRFIFFENGKAIGADLSQADGNMTFKASKQDDLYLIQAGDERYEFPEAVVYGG
jgi:hypothetical protein